MPKSKCKTSSTKKKSRKFRPSSVRTPTATANFTVKLAYTGSSSVISETADLTCMEFGRLYTKTVIPPYDPDKMPANVTKCFAAVTGCTWAGALTTSALVRSSRHTVSSIGLVATNYQCVSPRVISIRVDSIIPESKRQGYLHVGFIPFTGEEDVNHWFSTDQDSAGTRLRRVIDTVGFESNFSRLPMQRSGKGSRPISLRYRVPRSNTYLQRGLAIGTDRSHTLGIVFLGYYNDARASFSQISSNEVGIRVSIHSVSILSDYDPSSPVLLRQITGQVRDMLTPYDGAGNTSNDSTGNKRQLFQTSMGDILWGVGSGVAWDEADNCYKGDFRLLQWDTASLSKLFATWVKL